MRGVARGAALLLCARIAGLAMGVGVFALLTRGLTPASFGVFATILSLTQMATTPFDYSLGTVHAREALRRPELEGAIVRWSGRVRLVLGLALAGLLALAGPALVGAGHVPTLAIALGVLPVGWLFAAQPVLVRQRALVALSAVALVQGMLWLVAVAVLTATNAPLPLFGAAYVASVAVQGVTIRLMARRRRYRGAESHPLDLGAFLRLVRRGAGLAVVAVAGIIYFKVDAVILLRFSGPVEAGQYALAFRILEQATILPLTLHNVFSPRMLKALPGTCELGRVFDEYVRVALIVAAPLVVLGLFLAEPVVRLLFGERYLDAVPLLRALLPAFIPICLGFVMTAAAVSADRTGRQVATAVAALMVNVALNLWLIPVHGAAAAASVTLATEVVVVLGLYHGIRSVPGIRLPWAWSGRLLMALAGAAGTGLLVPSPVIGAACFAFAYAVLSVAAGVVSVSELRAGRFSLAAAAARS